jgi:hypothetical protein
MVQAPWIAPGERRKGRHSLARRRLAAFHGANSGRVAIKRQETMKSFLHSTLLAALVAALLLPAAAQVRTYDVVTADVPFKFNVGDRTFRPGHYQFIFVGRGLLALRDAKAHTVASLITRPVETSEPSPATKLVFKMQKKHARLAQISIESRSHVLEVLGEELAVRSSPSQPPSLPEAGFSFSDRSDVPRLKQ